MHDGGLLRDQRGVFNRENNSLGERRHAGDGPDSLLVTPQSNAVTNRNRTHTGQLGHPVTSASVGNHFVGVLHHALFQSADQGC